MTNNALLIYNKSFSVLRFLLHLAFFLDIGIAPTHNLFKRL